MFCVSCKSPNVARKYELTSQFVANRYYNQTFESESNAELKRHIEGLWKQDHVAIMGCLACDLQFSWPFVSGDATFYALTSDNTAYPQQKWEFERTVQSMLSGRGAGIRVPSVLEFGAGDGGFLRRLSQAGWPKTQLVALEFSDSGIARMRDEGFECHQSDIKSFKTDRTFDVVCMFQVLEHLSDLDAVFHHIRAVTHERSVLYIGVPNAGWLEDNEKRGIADDIPPNHVTRWRLKSFDALAHTHGWTLADADLEPPRRVGAAGYAFKERFVQAIRSDDGFYSRITARPPLSRVKQNARLLKLALALTRPDCLGVAVERFFASSPPNIWVKLAR